MKQKLQDKKAEGSKALREVNDKLHALRGEHFRHEQNSRPSRPLSAYQKSRGPSLPYDFIFPSPPAKTPSIQTAGPIPRSWVTQRPNSGFNGISNSSEWRMDALALVFSQDPTAPLHHMNNGLIPALTNLSLRVLLEYYGPESGSFPELVSNLTSHHRRELLRYTSIYQPLSSAYLDILLNLEGHTNGEVIVVGPQASMRSDFLRVREKVQPSSDTDKPSSQYNNGDSDSWDDDNDSCESPPIQSFILISAPLSASALLTLPPSLTHLALIGLPSPIPIHRLPRKCPLLEVLDLSYNVWLAPTAQGHANLLDGDFWSRWSRLRVLGLRNCGIAQNDASLKKVNAGRWTDAEIIV